MKAQIAILDAEIVGFANGAGETDYRSVGNLSCFRPGNERI